MELENTMLMIEDFTRRVPIHCTALEEFTPQPYGPPRATLKADLLGDTIARTGPALGALGISPMVPFTSCMSSPLGIYRRDHPSTVTRQLYRL